MPDAATAIPGFVPLPQDFRARAALAVLTDTEDVAEAAHLLCCFGCAQERIDSAGR